MKLITHKDYPNTFINGFSYDDIKKIGINVNPDVYTNDVYNIELYNNNSMHLIPNFPFTINTGIPSEKYIFPIKADFLTYSAVSTRLQFRNNFLKNEFTFDIPDDVISDVRKNKCKILIDYSSEPYNVTHEPIISCVHYVILRTIAQYSLSKTDLILAQANTVKYKTDALPYTVCTRNFPITAVPPLDYNDRDELHSLIVNKTIRPKKIISLMRKPRDHKITIAEYIFKNNLLDENIVTLSTLHGNLGKVSKNMLDTLPWQYDEYENNVTNIFSNSIFYKLQKQELNGYKETYINSAIESHMYPTEATLSPKKMNQYYIELDFTEKTMKPIIVMQPFFVFGQSGILARLKEQGYKTFDRWWDEGYDTIPNYSVRMNILLKLYKKLTKMPHDQLAEMMYEMLPVLEHNEQLYRDSHTNGTENLEMIETINKCFDK